MPKITVIRHAPANANEQGILMGSKLDSPLSEKGTWLAINKGIAFKKSGYTPERVYTSELLRAKQTAELILEELNIQALTQELEKLNERDFGEHDGKPYKSVLDAFDTYGDNPPTIETVKAFVGRVSTAWQRILAEAENNSLVVTHSNPVMVLQCLSFRPDEVNKFWELGDPSHCEGFTYEY